ncbi:hypothetical protein [Paraburkholderia susongensis]|uniref:Uncharacterized protein n=1 Tax=Paraburkholderia susongensis TaxID=1515439 RepID=A0A1X7M3L7_9BURK|nr:hypothetical protein [Paraburkholderia susongensis]SMG60334.1 hypothetical protein SAMN06265784_1163 [Paraburkholderia susongensis]
MQAHSSTLVATLADWRIGASGKDGACRVALTELDDETHEPFIARAKEAGNVLSQVTLNAASNARSARA